MIHRPILHNLSQQRTVEVKHISHHLPHLRQGNGIGKTLRRRPRARLKLQGQSFVDFKFFLSDSASS